MPAFASLSIDAEGNVWVKEYASPAESDPNRYLVFNPAGIWLGTVDAPDGLRLVDIGAGYVVGVTRESDRDVVTMHRLEK
jgi:hypothetical protein